jgi:cytidylate kinase
LEKINIAIDGHSSCGKGTLAKHLARELGYMFIDSGAMYRAVTLYLLRNRIDLETVESNPDILQDIDITFELDASKAFYFTYLNGENVETLIRGMEVSKHVSPVSKIKAVRDFLVTKQRLLGMNKGVVMDGRDIGTVVFPDAELKIYMTAEPEVRAKRRFLELKQKGMDVDYDQILENIKERDRIDSTRENSPLTKADDAITLNNTDMTKQEQARLALTWAKGVISALKNG